MKPGLILIHGKARSGKGEVAKRLCEKYGYVELGFADYLKELAVTVFGWDPDVIYRNRTPESRRFMQLLGEIGRICDPDFWIKKLEAKLKGKYFGKNIVVSDLRYKNEADWGKNNSGQLWLVERPGAEHLIEANPEHESEHSLDEWKIWDHVIVNDTTLADLCRKVDEIVCGEKVKLTKKEIGNKNLLLQDIIEILSDSPIEGEIINRLADKLSTFGWTKISFPARKWKK